MDYNNNINSSKEAELNERFHNDSDHYKGELKKFGLDGNYYYKILKDLNPRERNLLNAIATTDQGYKKVAHRKTEEWLLNTPLPSDQEAYKVASEYDEWINDERYISEDKTNLVMTENGPQMIKEKNPDYTKKMDEKKMRGWEVKAFHETAMLEMNIDSLNKSILKSNKKEGPANNPNAEKLKQNTEKLKKWRELKVARLKALKKRISNEQN